MTGTSTCANRDFRQNWYTPSVELPQLASTRQRPIRQIFQIYVDGEGLTSLAQELGRLGWRNKRWTTHKGSVRGGPTFDKTSLHKLLANVAYIGKVKYKDGCSHPSGARDGETTPDGATGAYHPS